MRPRLRQRLLVSLDWVLSLIIPFFQHLLGKRDDAFCILALQSLHFEHLKIVGRNVDMSSTLLILLPDYFLYVCVCMIVVYLTVVFIHPRHNVRNESIVHDLASCSASALRPVNALASALICLAPTSTRVPQIRVSRSARVTPTMTTIINQEAAQYDLGILKAPRTCTKAILSVLASS